MSEIQAGQLTQCANVDYYCDVGNNANCCGPDLSSQSAGANLGATSVDGAVITNRSTGTLKKCIYTGSTPPTVAQIDAGTAPCVVRKTKSVSATGQVNFTSGDAFTGLTASTEYRSAAYHDDGTGRPNFEVVTTAPFTTLAGAPPGGSDLTNAGYFVASSGCSDSYNGLHPRFTSGSDGPWCNTSKVNNSVTVSGSNVYYEQGGVYSGKLTVDWAGTSSDTSLISCFSWNGSNAETCDGSDTKPIIDGQLDSSNYLTENYTQTGDLASVNDGQVVLQRDWAELNYIAIRESMGRCLSAKGLGYTSGTTANTITGIRITDVDVSYCAFNFGVFENKVADVIIKDSTFKFGSLCEISERNGNSASNLPNQATCGTNGNPGGLAFVRSLNTYALVENVTIGPNGGEGFNCLSSSRIWIRNSRIANILSGSSYGDACPYLLDEQNTYVGTANSQCGPTVGDCGSKKGGGVNQNIENSASTGIDSGPAIRRNNIIVAPDIGFNIALGTTAQAAGRTIEAYILHNTIVAPSSSNGGLRSFQNLSSFITTFHYKNNIIADSDHSTSLCNFGGGAVFSENHWWFQPSDTDCRDAGDSTGDPGFATAYADFLDFDYTDFPDATDVTTTPAIAGDDDTLTDTVCVYDSWFNDTMLAAATANSGTFSKANICKAAYWNHAGDVRSSPTRKGAH